MNKVIIIGNLTKDPRACGNIERNCVYKFKRCRFPSVRKRRRGARDGFLQRYRVENAGGKLRKVSYER